MTANSKVVYDYLTSQGLSQIGAAGVVGNFMQESNVDPTAGNAKRASGGPYGIAQWLGSRLTALESFALGKREDVHTLLPQEQFAVQELKSTGVWDQLNRATTPAQASDIVFTKYERAGDNSGPKRQQYAEQAYANAGNVPGSSSDNQGTLSAAGEAIAGAPSAVAGAVTGAISSAMDAAVKAVGPVVLKSVFLLGAIGLGGYGVWRMTAGPRERTAAAAAKIVPAVL